MVLLSAIILICIRVISLPFSIKSWFYTFIEGPQPISKKWKRHAEQLKPYKINILLRLCLFLTHIDDHLKTIESNIIDATNEQLLDFRSRQMAQCSMTGVAAALVAQVASSTLELQYMPTINWIVPALCTSTIIIALLSMYNSFVLHDYLTGFACAADLRAQFLYQAPNKNRQEEGGEDTIEEVREEESKLPCYDAAMKLWGPNYLLELAILLYIATIWIYWAIAWRMDLEESGVYILPIDIGTSTTEIRGWNGVGKGFELTADWKKVK
ncbi:hypothetical protein B9Z19DRAFT_1195001 [Tuber borchii]|uniref:Uncharacterized protein n=1 Tax=Tuber borchii TaxID=42251 RepID=A0A2T6ZKR8_TUBBO|nr:hypothetical protein B9Z19DRAFT_1195001 [Tuber borchii]